MKKSMIILLTVLITVFAMLLIQNIHEIIIVSEFSIDEYSEEIEVFQVPYVVNEIKNSKQAITEAKKIWYSMFGIVNQKYEDVLIGDKILVCFDKETDCWCVRGTIDEPILGAVPIALIKSDGTVLAVWMG